MPARSASANESKPTGSTMNSCRSTLLSACAPPLMMFIIGTGSIGVAAVARGAATAACFFDAATACALASDTPSSALAPRRPLFSVPSRSIRRRSSAAWSAASKPCSALAIVAVDVGDGLAARPCRGSASCRRRAVRRLPSCRWRRPTAPRAAEAAVGERDFGFERGIAAAVEDFAGVDLGDRGHRVDQGRVLRGSDGDARRMRAQPTASRKPLRLVTAVESRISVSSSARIFGSGQALGPSTERLVRVRMRFHEDAGDADRHRRARQHRHEFALAAGLAVRRRRAAAPNGWRRTPPGSRCRASRSASACRDTRLL